MHSVLFYLFSFLAVIGAVLLVSFRNPVSSALSMVLSFVGMAGLFIGLNAFFVGIVQILVYAGAIMVLFVFIIMLLDLSEETKAKFKTPSVIAGILLPLLLVFQVLGVIQKGPVNDAFSEINPAVLAAAAESPELEGQTEIIKSLTHEKTPQLPDTNLIGMTLFRHYNFPLQVMGVLLLVATVGVVVLSKRSSKSTKS
ncbi:MAG: NADH-quinone oxidoreductase subunit J family protein [Verrucomicrobiaceae bacterium]